MISVIHNLLEFLTTNVLDFLAARYPLMIEGARLQPHVSHHFWIHKWIGQPTRFSYLSRNFRIEYVRDEWRLYHMVGFGEYRIVFGVSVREVIVCRL